jgi:hypothetical protein
MQKTIERLEAVTQELAAKAIDYGHGKSNAARFMIYSAREMQVVANDLKKADKERHEAEMRVVGGMQEQIHKLTAEREAAISVSNAQYKELCGIKARWWFKVFGGKA